MGLFDYMTNDTYRKASKEYNNASKKIKKLQKCKKDLEDDSGDINNISRQVDGIIENFSNAIKITEVRGVVADRLRNIKEPIETADIDLCNARGYIDREMQRLSGKMRNAKNVMDGESGNGGGRF